MKVPILALLLVTALHAGNALAAEKATSAQPPGQIEVPTFASGLVEAIDRDFCMDGVKYRLRTQDGSIRIQGNNAETTAVLEKVVGSRTAVAVGGYWHDSTEFGCRYLQLYYADDVPHMLNKLIGKDKLR